MIPAIRFTPLACLALALTLAACQPELHVTDHQPVEPPFAQAKSIPDAPLFGTLRGEAFQIKDARYVPDHRDGFARLDIKLSAGKADAACDEIKPADAASVWLRLEGSDTIHSQEFNLMPGQESPWSIHYQVHGPDGWHGSMDAAAVVALQAAGSDGRITGELAVCFADDLKSCVSGSFAADACPYHIDAAARGPLPQETIPEKYRDKLKAAPTASASASAGSTAAPSASASAKDAPKP